MSSLGATSVCRGCLDIHSQLQRQAPVGCDAILLPLREQLLQLLEEFKPDRYHLKGRSMALVLVASLFLVHQHCLKQSPPSSLKEAQKGIHWFLHRPGQLKPPHLAQPKSSSAPVPGLYNRVERKRIVIGLSGCGEMRIKCGGAFLPAVFHVAGELVFDVQLVSGQSLV